ncbi:YdcF family protein [Shewanella sp. 0m-8]
MPSALEAYQLRPDSRLLLTGGFGEHFNQTTTPHALYCQRYLIKHGVPQTAFTDIVLSRFTFEDATFSMPIVAKYGFTELCLVTSEFHLPRAKLIFNSLLPNFSVNYVAAKTPVSESKLQQLMQHELSVMDRERRNLDALTIAER